MRITGGQWKGRRPKISKGFRGRPTTDFGREGLFNLMRSRADITDAVVLDLFAGTGMVGLEFLSRGAESVTSVELDPRAIRGLSQLARDWELDQWQIVRGDAMLFAGKSLTQFDIVFADPPFDLPQLAQLPETVLSGDVVGSRWLVYLGARRANGCILSSSLYRNTKVWPRAF